MSVPYTDSEASEARQWSNRYGPPNAWTASLGTAARMIGRLLDERERLMAKQTVAEYRAWVAQNAAIVKASKEGLRDHFAAAALTGFASQPRFNCGSVLTLTAKQCYELADAMLRERERTNLDAAPAAIASVESVAPQPTTHGESDRTDKAAPRPSEGTGDTQEPVAWGVANGNGLLATSIHRIDAVDMQSEHECDTAVVPLYRQPTLTDAEREAVEWAATHLDNCGWGSATLRGLLERTK